MCYKNYSKKVYSATYIHLGVFVDGELLGVLQYGYAMNPASCGSVVEGTEMNQYLELNRMWLSVDISIKNAQTAGVDKLIEFKTCDFRETEIPEETGVIVFNPEYGERLGVHTRLESTYKEIGDFLKQSCRGYRGYIFTGNPELAKKIGLRAAKKTEFYNGRLDCRLMEYELYEGTKRQD